MFTYESGLLLAFLMWLWHAIAIVVSINSKLERNLNKIGQRLSWFALMPKPLYAADQKRSVMKKIMKYLLVIGLNAPFIFLSWLSIAWWLCLRLYSWSKNYGEPQARREFRWKMKNIDMSFDQIIRELLKANEEDPDKFEQFREETLAELKERGLQTAW